MTPSKAAGLLFHLCKAASFPPCSRNAVLYKECSSSFYLVTGILHTDSKGNQNQGAKARPRNTTTLHESTMGEDSVQGMSIPPLCHMQECCSAPPTPATGANSPK